MITLVQGETYTVEIARYEDDGTPANLTGAVGAFAYCDQYGDNEVITRQCTIDENIVSYTLTSSETAIMNGLYDVEMKLKDSLGNIDTIFVDQMIIKESIIPEFPTFV